MPTTTRRWGRRALPLALAAAALLVLPGVVLADTELGHTGTVGAHRLRDATGYPGARCNHTGPATEEILTSIRVRTPVVFARNRTSGLDMQRVGWRARLQHRAETSTSWVYLSSKAVERDTATDRHPAEFTPQTFSISGDGAFRIVVQMYWYNASGTVVGTATHRVDRYAILLNGAQVHEQGGYCSR